MMSPSHGHGHHSGCGWDKHHIKCITDNAQILKSEVQAKQLQISKLTTERDTLKRRIIELKSEVQKVKEKTFKKQHVESLRETLEKKENQLYSLQNKSQK